MGRGRRSIFYNGDPCQGSLIGISGGSNAGTLGTLKRLLTPLQNPARGETGPSRLLTGGREA